MRNPIWLVFGLGVGLLCDARSMDAQAPRPIEVELIIDGGVVKGVRAKAELVPAPSPALNSAQLEADVRRILHDLRQMKGRLQPDKGAPFRIDIEGMQFHLARPGTMKMKMKLLMPPAEPKPGPSSVLELKLVPAPGAPPAPPAPPVPPGLPVSPPVPPPGIDLARKLDHLLREAASLRKDVDDLKKAQKKGVTLIFQPPEPKAIEKKQLPPGLEKQLQDEIRKRLDELQKMNLDEAQFRREVERVLKEAHEAMKKAWE